MREKEKLPLVKTAEKAEISRGNPGFSLRKEINRRLLHRDQDYRALFFFFLKCSEVGLCNKVEEGIENCK